MTPLFDRTQVRRQRARANAHIDSHFLFDWTRAQLEERLSLVKLRKFGNALQIGGRGGIVGEAQQFENFILTDFSAPPGCLYPRVICEEDVLPFAPDSFDLVFSALTLHTVNDLPGALIQIRKSLRPDGIFIAALLGGDTLNELRVCLGEAELALSGGMAPRVAPFAGRQDMSALLQRAGFGLPVVDSEKITVTYESLFALTRDLRHMGEGNALSHRKKSFTRKTLFLDAARIYAERFTEPSGRIVATFEVIFLIGWGPAGERPL